MSVEKTYEVFNSFKGEQMVVNDEWLDSIPRKGITELELYNLPNGDGLKVTYANRDEVHYKTIHGTWGDPTVVR